MGIEPGTTEQRRSNARTTTRPTVVWLTKMLEERHSFQHRHCNSRLHNVNMSYSNEQTGSRNKKNYDRSRESNAKPLHYERAH